MFYLEIQIKICPPPPDLLPLLLLILRRVGRGKEREGGVESGGVGGGVVVCGVLDTKDRLLVEPEFFNNL